MPQWQGPRIRFKCLLCGECCRLYWVPITHKDLYRIHKATGLDPLDFAAHVPKDAVGEWGVPAFLLSDGRAHYLVLKKRLDGFCIFTKLKDGHFICTIYEARPIACRFYPYVYVPGDVVKFELAEGAAKFCPGIGKGPVHDLSAEAEAALLREKEMEGYKEFVKTWNAFASSSPEEASFRRFLEEALRWADGGGTLIGTSRDLAW